MKIIETQLNGVVLIEPKVFEDERGAFFESWNQATFADLGLDLRFTQDNHVTSGRGVLRGLHYQTRHVQGKLLRVTAGEVFDVSVDLRESSPTFGQWHGEWLSAENRRILWVPEGFANGFYVTSDRADLLFKATGRYDPSSEYSLIWNDPRVGIDWPLVDGAPPILSVRDAAGVGFTEAPKLP
jgi:dTDP-4-dehydrorhamnose 3,5-epimerase